MHQESPSSSRAPDAARLVLGLARQLHKAALSDSLTLSLPVLRRVLATASLRGLSLPALRRQRDLLRRKHILRMLAVEAGHASWEDYRRALASMTPEALPHFDLMRSSAGYPNLWFSSGSQARAHASAQGGRVVQVGDQAVVLCETGAGN